MLRKGISVLLLMMCAFSWTIFAQEIIFSADASSNKVGLQDRLQVNYSIKNVSGVDNFERPAFSGFRILGGPIQSFRNINGRSSMSVSYVLQPLRKGIHIIPAATAIINGKPYTSNTLRIEVVEGTLSQQNAPRRRQPTADDFFGDNSNDDPFAQMDQMMQQMMQDQQRLIEEMQRRQQAMMQQYQRQYGNGMANNLPLTREDIAKNLFIIVTADNTRPYLGQQVNVSYKVCSRMEISSGYITKLPSLNGFWSEDYEIPKNPQAKIEYINGVPFQTLLIKKTAVFPQQTGTLELDPATATCVLPYYGNIDIASKPVNIHVKPLPDNRPESFTGAVGRFTIEANVDKQELTTDDAGTFTFRVSGSGNIKLIDQPHIKFPDGLGVFDPQITDTITSRNPVLQGAKIFRYSFNPQYPGTYTIPVVEFSYFDAAAGQYKTLQTQPFTIQVKEGKNAHQTIAGMNNKGSHDILDIIHKPYQPVSASTPLITKAWYWSMYGLPTLAFIGLLAYRRRQNDLIKNAAVYKIKKANKVAWKRLAIARKLLNTTAHAEFYEAISKAIWLYLSDKLAIPLSELSKDNIAYQLQAKQAPEMLIERTLHLISECEMALYSPSGGGQQKVDILQSAGDLIGDFESVLK